MSNDHSFRKSLNLFDSTAIVVGSMIGSGIFIVSADIARQVGSPGLLMAVWLITGFLTICAALSYGELAGMFPKAGGQYVYLKEAYGPLVGFLYGWTLFLVIQTGTIAAVAVAFGKFTATLMPALDTAVHLGPVTVSAQQGLAIAIVVLLTAANCNGLRTGKIVQNVFTVTKVGSLLVLVVFGFAFGRNPVAVHANLTQFWGIPSISLIPL